MATGSWGGALDTHVFDVNIRMRRDTNHFQTGFHLRDVGVQLATAQNIADHVATFVTDSFRNILDADVQVEGIDAVNMVSGEGGTVSPAGQFGTVSTSGGELPLYVTTPVSFKGSVRKRYGQGRGLWPMTVKPWVERDVLTDAGAAAVQGVIDFMADRYIGSTATHLYLLVNLHGVLPPRAATPTRPARPEIPATWYDVTSIRLNRACSFLRSRKSGVGS